MSKTEQKTINKIAPYIILVTEIIVFYGATGWLFGVWNSEYPHESNLHFAVTFFYIFGVLTFLFFVIALLSMVIKQPFTKIIIFFTLSVMPCMFLSFALTNTLWLNIPYAQSLKDMWDTRNGFIPFLVSHILGFMLALILRKVLKAVNFRRIKPYLTFTDEP